MAWMLDDAERAHLFDLVAPPTPPRRHRPRDARAWQPVRPELRNMLEAMSGVPA